MDRMRAPTPLEMEDIWRRFDTPLRRFVSRRVRSQDAVDDIVQDVYLKIHSAIATLREPERVDAWVFRIARNVVVDYYRGRRTHADLDDGLADVEQNREEVRFQDGLRDMVRRMVARLPSIYREALSMTDLQGVRQVEAARQLGISASGMKSRVQRGRQMLRTMLLDCCHFELDRRGKVIDYQPRCRCCTVSPWSSAS